MPWCTTYQFLMYIVIWIIGKCLLRKQIQNYGTNSDKCPFSLYLCLHKFLLASTPFVWCLAFGKMLQIRADFDITRGFLTLFGKIIHEYHAVIWPDVPSHFFYLYFFFFSELWKQPSAYEKRRQWCPFLLLLFSVVLKLVFDLCWELTHFP